MLSATFASGSPRAKIFKASTVFRKNAVLSRGAPPISNVTWYESGGSTDELRVRLVNIEEELTILEALNEDGMLKALDI